MGLIIRDKSKVVFASKTSKAKAANKHKASMVAIASAAAEHLPSSMQIERREISSLKGQPKRVRKTEASQLERVCKSITKLKQSAPVLVDKSGRIINGHIVVQALRELGEEHIWCAVIDHLDQDECNMLHIALNRIAETGDFDLDALGDLMIELDDLGFELETTGFSPPELDIILTPDLDEADPAEDDLPEVPSDPVSQLGDLWLLGKNRLLCGDATEQQSYVNVFDGELADVIFTDLPFNIPIEGFVSGLGKVKHGDFKQGAGEMSAQEFRDFCDKAHLLGATHLANGGVFFSCIDWRSVNVIMKAGRDAGLRHINTAVWNKGSGGMGSPYRSSHEFIVVFAKGKKLAVNNVELGKHGRDRTNVWTYPGANRPGSSAGKALAHHPTPKPIEMVRDALLDVSKRGSLVLDPFMGSGTTLLAAECSGRRAAGIELDPGYVDVIIKRWEEVTGDKAIHAETGLGLVELAAQRSAADQVSDAA